MAKLQVTVESWPIAGRFTISRGASWDALVDGEGKLDSGAMLYVVTANGNTLKVTTRRPA